MQKQTRTGMPNRPSDICKIKIYRLKPIQIWKCFSCHHTFMSELHARSVGHFLCLNYSLRHNIQMNWWLLWSKWTNFPRQKPHDLSNSSYYMPFSWYCFITTRHESVFVLPLLLIQSCSVSTPKHVGAEPAAPLHKCLITARFKFFFSPTLLQMWTENNGPPVLTF